MACGSRFLFLKGFMKLRFGISVLLSFAIMISFCAAFSRPTAATFYGEPGVGWQTLALDRYGVSYYVPTDYSPDVDWPLVVVIYSDEVEKGKRFVEKWLQEIKKRKVIGLFVSYLSPRELPYKSDRRILTIIRELKQRYSIDSDKVLLTAFGEAAHYAFYVGFEYPREFRAVGLIAGGAQGRYGQFLRRGNSRAKTVSFLVLFGKKDQNINRDVFVSAHEELTAKGYQVDLEEFEGLGRQSDPQLLEKILDWFAELSSNPTGLRTAPTSDRSDRIAEPSSSPIVLRAARHSQPIAAKSEPTAESNEVVKE